MQYLTCRNLDNTITLSSLLQYRYMFYTFTTHIPLSLDLIKYELLVAK